MNRIVLLGTGGGPKIWAKRSQPSSAIIINDSVYIIDTGDGICTQLAKAHIDIKKIKAIFITHNHSDHVADLGTLLLRSWQSGHQGEIHCFGPNPIMEMIDSYKNYMKWDIELRIKDENRPDFESIYNVTEIREMDNFYSDNNLKVECITVPHGAAKPSFAYKFLLADKVIVFSGDTSKSSKLIEFSQNADFLIHEVLNLDGVDSIIQKTHPGNQSFRNHIIESHTSMIEVGEVAKASNVKTLILNHLVPTASPIYDKEEVWLSGVSRSFNGNIIVGDDLLEIDI